MTYELLCIYLTCNVNVKYLYCSTQRGDVVAVTGQMCKLLKEHSSLIKPRIGLVVIIEITSFKQPDQFVKHNNIMEKGTEMK